MTNKRVNLHKLKALCSSYFFLELTLHFYFVNMKTEIRSMGWPSPGSFTTKRTVDRGLKTFYSGIIWIDSSIMTDDAKES